MVKENSVDVLIEISKDLTAERPRVKKFLETMLKKGLLGLEVNLETEESFTDITSEPEKNTYFIRLGALPISKRYAEQLIFLRHTLTEQEEIQYKLLHEISHVFLEELTRRGSDNAKLLIRLCSGQNKKDGNFFTSRGKFSTLKASKKDSYKLPEGMIGVGSIIEDAVELLCMAQWSDHYFDLYVAFLSDESLNSEKNKIGVHSLTRDEASLLREIVIQVVAEGATK